MNKRKLQILLLGSFALLPIIWVVTTDYLPHLEFGAEWLINASSILTVASFSVRGMLPLRVLAVASGAFAMPYFMLQSTPLWTPVGWTALFMVINLSHVTRILLERRPVKFSPDEQTLYDLTFGNFAPREFLKLLKVGKWETAHKGERIYSEGDFITQIVVPISGSVSGVQRGQRLGTLAPGELIGAGTALAGQSSAFEATFTEDSKYMSWSKPDLDKFIERNPELSGKFNDVVNRNLVAQINKLALNFTGGAPTGQVEPAQT